MEIILRRLEIGLDKLCQLDTIHRRHLRVIVFHLLHLLIDGIFRILFHFDLIHESCLDSVFQLRLRCLLRLLLQLLFQAFAVLVHGICPFDVCFYPVICKFRYILRVDLIEHDMEISHFSCHIRCVVIRELYGDIKRFPCLVTCDLIFKSRIVSRGADVTAGAKLELLRLRSPAVKCHSIQISCKIYIYPVAHLCRAVRYRHFFCRTLKIGLDGLLHLVVGHFRLFRLRYFQSLILGHCHIFIGQFSAAASRKCTG